MENNPPTILTAMNIKPLVAEHSSLLKLMRLTSPSLPIGAYSYSQGLEYAVAEGWIHDSASMSDWVLGLIKNSQMRLDVPIFKRLYQAWQENNIDTVHYWNDYLLASRDAFELQKEDRQQGKALARLLVDLDLDEAETFSLKPNGCFLTLYSLAAVRWDILLTDAANGFLWMWAENQVLAAIKLIPLGQTAGQKILSQVIESIPNTVTQGLALKDGDLGYTSPGQGVASALHEIQYTRLFRS